MPVFFDASQLFVDEPTLTTRYGDGPLEKAIVVSGWRPFPGRSVITRSSVMVAAAGSA